MWTTYYTENNIVSIAFIVVYYIQSADKMHALWTILFVNIVSTITIIYFQIELFI